MINNFSGKPQQKQLHTQGFTLIEVLAAMLMATVFVLVATQAIAISAVFRVRAQRESEALQWIQKDIESIKFIALSQLSATCAVTDPDSTATPPIATTGYAKALIDEIVANPVNPDEVVSSSSVDALPNTVTFSRNLLNKPHTMTRTLAVYDASPFYRVDVNYSVAAPENLNNEIANYYTEVVPDAAFACD